MAESEHKNNANHGYDGTHERRKHQRRSGEDRRVLIRFEPEKESRRSGNDRRH